MDAINKITNELKWLTKKPASVYFCRQSGLYICTYIGTMGPTQFTLTPEEVESNSNYFTEFLANLLSIDMERYF